MKALKEYITVRFDLGEAYIKKSRLREIAEVNAIIFDCDGVLIDVRESYDKAIARATSWIFEALTGHKIPEELISSEVIFSFRRSGGFNNDHDIVYGLLMFLLSEMPAGFIKELSEAMKTVECGGSNFRKVLAVGDMIRAAFPLIDAGVLINRLKDFTYMLNNDGVASIDRAILSSKGIPRDVYDTLKSFLYGSGRVSGSIIAKVFEEIFCGPELFRRVYGLEPELFHGPGTIENSWVIVRRETLESFSQLVGWGKLGIASGSMFAPAKHVLGDILEYFNPRALVFLNDVRQIEEEYLRRGFLKISLAKPNPYQLFKSAWSLEPFKNTLYIGDSMEDVFMVERANKLDQRFIFAGVYAYTGAKDMALHEFLKSGCDIISPSVNEIPSIIEAVRRRVFEGGGIL
ncbi:MAG: hypothetical protein QXJ19_01535 [Candidatus Bathyarchaeia archaeon]|nr:hypothetical protein [Candidatus Bathyarchaeota archaeon]